MNIDLACPLPRYDCHHNHPDGARRRFWSGWVRMRWVVGGFSLGFGLGDGCWVPAERARDLPPHSPNPLCCISKAVPGVSRC